MILARELKHKSNDLTKMILTKLNATFITPIDREDIQQVNLLLNKITRKIVKATLIFKTYQLTEYPETLKQQSDTILKATGELNLIVDKFKNFIKVEEITQSNERMDEIETHGDEVLYHAMLDLFSGKYDSLTVIKLRDIYNKDENSELYLPFLLKEALKVFQNDKESKYITENNSEFLEETAAIKNFRYNDSFLRPPMVSKCVYDIWSGSIGAQTPLRYNLEYRTFLYITSGKAKLKKDYDNFEFRSLVNPWNVQNRYKADFDKVKVLDLDIVPGYIIFIPAYWWYSIEYAELSSICVFKYRTFMSSLSTLPQTLMSYLQKQNIKREIAKKLDIVDNLIPLNNEMKTDIKVQ